VQSIAAAGTFVTAPSQPVNQDIDLDRIGAGIHLKVEDNEADSQVPGSASSSTALLRPPPRQNSHPHMPNAAPPKSILREVSAPELRRNGQSGAEDGVLPHPPPSPNKGKLVVHYSDTPEVTTPGPAPPAEVLKRTGSAVEETSAGAAAQALPQDDLRWGDIVMRGEMLWVCCHISANQFLGR
jgi:hypothetical protein